MIFIYFFCRAFQEICNKYFFKSMWGVHFTILPASPCAAEFYEIWHTRSATDIITCVKFLVDRFRGYGVLTPQNCHFPLTCCVTLTTVYALPCDTDKYCVAFDGSILILFSTFFGRISVSDLLDSSHFLSLGGATIVVKLWSQIAKSLQKICGKVCAPQYI